MDSISRGVDVPPTMDDRLLAEGYLKKIRGFMQNRTRYFRLTMDHFAFYKENCGQLISYISRREITQVKDLSSDRFEVVTSAVFGASGAKTMILEAATAAIKARWLRALENDGDIVS